MGGFRNVKAGVCSILAAILIAVCVPATAGGQATSTGTIAGQVTDASGAAVVGATVTLTDTATNTGRTTTTNDTGRYLFVDVAPGNYSLTVTKTGFRSTKVDGLEVKVGVALTSNVSLQLGTVTQTVEVSANMGGELQTMNATVGNTITGVSLEALPSLGRDVSSFIVLQPGVTPDGSVAGAVYDQTSFQLDGGNNSNDMDGSMNIYTPSFAGDPTGGLVSFYVQGGPGSGGGPTGVMPTPTDSIEEFKVSTNNQTADFNSSAGAQVSMVTKRGTNNWHGTVYEYYLDNNWNANLWDNNATGTPIPSFHYNRFGGAVGGPIVPKSIGGGKTYFFANYQGFRWPNSETVERTVPSDAMRLGLLQFGGNVYNLNPKAVTYNGTTYPADTGALDPRLLGISPAVQQLWSKLPEPNDLTQCPLTLCDSVNVQGFKGNMAIPQNDNFAVTRFDHDFGSKWHFNTTYRYYHLTRATHSQFDISNGTPVSLSNRPQVPWYFVAGMTTNITPNFTNDFHYSYLRNFWQWGDLQDPPQFSGLGGALEPFGEDRTNVLAPYNVDTQDTRTRFWDGKDNMFRDDLSLLKGNHLFTFGGTYQHNWDYHQRTDNGGGINYEPVYQLGTTSGAGISMAGFVPASVPSGEVTNYGRDYAAVLGIVSVAQTAYTRSGPNLTLNPPLTPAFDQSTIPYYNVYFADSWHMKPSFTLTYGLGWTLEMPPVEKNGKQIVLVDQANQPVDLKAYIKSRESAALQGQVYNPIIGFTLVHNTANGLKYPYDPFYGSFSPRVAVAWNPHFDGDSMLGKVFGPGSTVVRGGYSRIYGRLNGVDLVLVPLLGTGLIQPVQCIAALSNGQCSSAATPATAFRLGPTSSGFDGLVAPLPAASPTLPQPDFPGINAVAAGAGSVLDPHFRPNASDQFDLTIQRQLSRKALLEVGYIGRLLHDEYQPVNINAVPYMMTFNGQTFAKAYAAIETALGCATSNRACGANIPTSGGQAALTAYANTFTPQPFFDPPAGGTAALNASYCAGYSSCTAAVVGNEIQKGNLQTQSVWNLWSDLDNGNFTFPRTMLNTPFNCSTGVEIGCGGQSSSGVAVNASIGHANYHALFASIRTSDWHGLTLQSNFTYGKALGTGATVQATSAFTLADPYNLDRNYGLQTWDRKFVYNVFLVYEPPFYKGQHGLTGRLLGGWTFAPVFSTGSGLPLEVNTANLSGQSYGEGDSLNYFGGEFTAYNFCGCGPGENGMLTGSYNQGNSRHDGVPGSNGIGTSGFGVNMFRDPASVYLDLFRPAILGLDTGRTGAAGVLRGLPYWNMDLSISKVVNITERVNFQFTTIFTNVFNHPQFGDPYMQIGNPSAWGVLPGQWNTPRQMELGLRVRF